MSNLVSKVATLEVIGIALIYSTAIELAYTLFTDGPDEAISPLLTGVAGAILIGVSDSKNFTIEGAGTIMVYPSRQTPHQTAQRVTLLPV